jgi:hypothetical protein
VFFRELLRKYKGCLGRLGVWIFPTKSEEVPFKSGLVDQFKNLSR